MKEEETEDASYDDGETLYAAGPDLRVCSCGPFPAQCTCGKELLPQKGPEREIPMYVPIRFTVICLGHTEQTFRFRSSHNSYFTKIGLPKNGGKVRLKLWVKLGLSPRYTQMVP